jgi:hypothetical protein
MRLLRPPSSGRGDRSCLPVCAVAAVFPGKSFRKRVKCPVHLGTPACHWAWDVQPHTAIRKCAGTATSTPHGFRSLAMRIESPDQIIGCTVTDPGHAGPISALALGCPSAIHRERFTGVWRCVGAGRQSNGIASRHDRHWKPLLAIHAVWDLISSPMWMARDEKRSRWDKHELG